MITTRGKQGEYKKHGYTSLVEAGRWMWSLLTRRAQPFNKVEVGSLVDKGNQLVLLVRRELLETHGVGKLALSSVLARIVGCDRVHAETLILAVAGLEHDRDDGKTFLGRKLEEPFGFVSAVVIFRLLGDGISVMRTLRFGRRVATRVGRLLVLVSVLIV